MQIPGIRFASGLLPFALLATPGASAPQISDSYVVGGSGYVWVCEDIDGSGDYLGDGEVSVYYDGMTGSVPLASVWGVVRANDGDLYVTDTNRDMIVRLTDTNADGDAQDPGEAIVWFDGRAGSGTGLRTPIPVGQWRDEDGVHWLVTDEEGEAGTVDAIVRLEDLNGDGDANDQGEAVRYANLGSGADRYESIPMSIVRGPDGALYYSDSGDVQRGVWRLEDLDGSGRIDRPGERTRYFYPYNGGTSWIAGLAVEPSGDLLLVEQGYFDTIWRFRDVNGDGTVTQSTEAVQVVHGSVSSVMWTIAVSRDGSIYAPQDWAPDRVQRYVDLDGDGTSQGWDEVQELYDDSIGSITFGTTTALAIDDDGLMVGESECGPAVANSTGVPARSDAIGSPRVSANNITLIASDLPPNATTFFLVGPEPTSVPGAGGSQGTLCLGGPIGRYSSFAQSSGASGSVELPIDLTTIPRPTGTASVAAGETWRFQAWYRDANPGLTSNFTDAVAITFVP